MVVIPRLSYQMESKSQTLKTVPLLFPSCHGERYTRVHDAKGNTYASLRKTGTDEMLRQSGPSSSYFFDNPEKKRSPLFKVIPIDSLASPIPI